MSLSLISSMILSQIPGSVGSSLVADASFIASKHILQKSLSSFITDKFVRKSDLCQDNTEGVYWSIWNF